MAERTNMERRQTALPARIGNVGTDLADCLAEAESLGLNAPDHLFATLLDLETWAGEVREGRIRSVRLVGGIDLETEAWLRGLRAVQAAEDDGTVIPLPQPLKLPAPPRAPLLVSVLHATGAAQRQFNRRLTVVVGTVLAVAALVGCLTIAWMVAA